MPPRSRTTKKAETTDVAVDTAPDGSGAETETDTRKLQFPALANDPVGEVAQRSPEKTSGLSYRTMFVMRGSFDGDHPQHEDNKLRVVEEAVQRGLHPRGEPFLAESEEKVTGRRGEVSTWATYEVDVTPASTDDEPYKTVTPSRLKPGGALSRVEGTHGYAEETPHRDARLDSEAK